MYINFELNAKESSKKSPFEFFIDFYKRNLIELARDSFLDQLPNLNDENDYWISNCSEVNKQKEFFILEFSEEQFDDNNNFIGFNHISVTISFKNELEKLFTKEYFISKRLIQEKITCAGDDKSNTKSLKEYIRDFFAKAISIINLIETSPIYVNYVNECLQPFYEIIRLFYNDFFDFAPNQEIDPCIKKILQSSLTTQNLYVPNILDRNIIEKILALTDLKGKLVFKVKNIRDARVSLNYLLDKDFDKINHPIEIISNFGTANFIIATLIYYLGYTRKEIEKKKIFKIGKSFFLAKPCDTEFSRINKYKPDLALKVNLVFRNSLSS
jgi:hypothetical protein